MKKVIGRMSVDGEIAVRQNIFLSRSGHVYIQHKVFEINKTFDHIDLEKERVI